MKEKRRKPIKKNGKRWKDGIRTSRERGNRRQAEVKEANRKKKENENKDRKARF